MKKLLIMAWLLSLFSFGYACTNEPREPLPLNVGTVIAISNKTEYKPLTNWIFSESQGLASDGMRLSINDGELNTVSGNVRGRLQHINHSDDFRIEIDGENAGQPRYTLYYNSGRQLNDGDMLILPDISGEYFLCVTLSWSNNDTGKYLAHSGFEYWFFIIIE